MPDSPTSKMASQTGVTNKLKELPNLTLALQLQDPNAKDHSKRLIVPLIKGGDEPERLISDEMGSEIVTIFIGKEEAMFNIHKNLIRRTSAYFFDMYKTEPPAGRRFALNDEDPQVFKLFVEFLYTQRVPAVSTTMSDGARALRTKQLCQLYAFADRFQVQFEIRNRIMDKIQDGFAVLDKFPEPGLVQAIYSNSNSDSRLRHFALAGVYTWFRNVEDVKNKEFKTLLSNNSEVLDDFLDLIRSESINQDPRIRQCHGWHGCAECAQYGHERIKGHEGIFPCEFHIHKGIIACVKEGANGHPGTNTEDVEVYDQGCHLWTEFPDRAWMEKYVLKLD